VARFDKYDPISGGFRAPLAVDWPSGDLSKVIPVGLDASGRIVKGAGNTGIVGVVCLTKVLYAGEIADAMTDGEIVEATGLVAGTVYNAEADGDVVTTAGTRIGHTVEATRLVVRVAR
jgi:hypothetical protein